MAFQLPPLPYDFKALEPHIDAQTMEIHHDKHHAAYVNNANAALEKHPELGSKSVEDLLWGIDTVPQDIRTVIRNNAGGHSNHSIFWSIMGPGGGGNPPGRLGDTIKNEFGGYDAFKELLQKAAVGQFGSGWAWLLADKKGKLTIKSYPNQDSPYMEGLTPILGVDVWEHAYYLKYQNKRADYVAAWFNTLNWEAIEARFASVWVS
jgi:superoxide dismutase, Fe-Mn family